MRTKRWGIIVSLALGAVLLEACLMPLRGYDLTVSGVAALFVFGIYAFLCLTLIKTIKPNINVCAIAIGLLLLHLPFRIIDWKGSMITFPDAIMHFVGIAAGYLFWLTNRKIKFLIVLPCVLMISTGYFYGFHYFLNKLNFDTWTGKLEQTGEKISLTFQTYNGESINIEDFKGNYLLLDFWATTCAACFKTFPEVQNLYDEYFSDKNVSIISVHCRYDRKCETYTTGSKIISNSGYTFPCLSIDLNNPMLTSLGVICLPAVLIFAPDGQLLFRGNIDSAGRYLKRLVDTVPRS